MNRVRHDSSVHGHSREDGKHVPFGGWSVCRLGDPNISTLVMGQSPPSNTYNTQKIGLPFFQGKADFGYIHPSPRVWCSEPTRTGQAGDILMSVRAPVGDVNLATEACALGRGVAAIRAAPQSNSIFLYYALQFYKPQLVAASSGAIFESINKSALHDLEIHLPSEPEQEKIAAVLWKLQRAIITQDKLLKAAADLKQSAMQRLFTHGLRGEPLKDTEIGPMPESWQPRCIPELCDIRSGGTPRKSTAEYWQGDIPWVSGKDLKAPSLDDAIDHVSPEGVAAGSRLAPEDSVLLLVRGMGLAKDLPVAVITRPMAFNQDIKALVPKGGYSGSFIRSAIYAGKERLLARIVASAHGTTTLNLDDVQSFAVASPGDPQEAEDIAASLATLDRKLAHHRRKRAALDALFQTSLHQLMTGEVRVAELEIDTSEVVNPIPEARNTIAEGKEGVAC